MQPSNIRVILVGTYVPTKDGRRSAKMLRFCQLKFHFKSTEIEPYLVKIFCHYILVKITFLLTYVLVMLLWVRGF